MKAKLLCLALLAFLTISSCQNRRKAQIPDRERIYRDYYRVLSISLMEQQEKRFFEKLGAYAICHANNGKIGRFQQCAPELRDPDGF